MVSRLAPIDNPQTLDSFHKLFSIHYQKTSSDFSPAEDELCLF